MRTNARNLQRPKTNSTRNKPALSSSLWRLLSQRPALNEVYHLMSEIWTHTTLVPSEKVLATLAAGVSLFPRDPELAYEVALLHLRSGQLGRPRPSQLRASILRPRIRSCALNLWTSLQPRGRLIQLN
jgi:hypothetical protein